MLVTETRINLFDLDQARMRVFFESIGDKPFRAYIGARIFTNLMMMAAPFYIGYATVDLVLRRKALKNHWEFAVSIRNLFNADARDPASPLDPSGSPPIPNDLPLAKRNYYAELRYRF